MNKENSEKSFPGKCSFQNHSKSVLLLLFFLLSFLIPQKVFSQEENEAEEITVYFSIQQVGGLEIPAMIKGTDLFLPVKDIFNFLKIKTVISDSNDSVSGFFLNPAIPYRIESSKNRIKLADQIFQLQPGDIIRTEDNLYLHDKYFGEIFGLYCKFNFRSLSVEVTTKIELPAVREMRLESMRQNVSRLKGEVKADTTIRRSYPVFHFGNADWSVISTQQIKGPTDNRINLGLGALLFGGEANVALNYSTSEPFTERQQYYLWRYANNDHKVVRQISAGRIQTGATSSLYAPVVGAQITNTPTTYRRSFGFYPLRGLTQPGWIVELYVNNVLVDYLKADASGFYTFEVPLVYGNSNVKLRFYGPWGEEQSREQNISIPFNFLPPGDLEYTVSAGIVEDTLSSRFSKANVNYGISRRITMGGGVEYLSSVKSGPAMPFLNMSLRLASSFLVTGEYTHGVRFKGMVNYRLPSNVSFDILYTRYNKKQTAINFNILEERKATISAPVFGKKFSAFIRGTVDQIILPSTRSTTAELLVSGAVFGIGTNLTTYAVFAEKVNPYVYSNVSLSFKFLKGFVLTPQAQFEYNHSELISAKAELEKRIFRNGFANLSFERNFKSDINNTQIGFRYDLSAVQTAFTFRQTDDRSNLIETARGSLLYDQKTHYLAANSRTSVGRGGVTIKTFLDFNSNGIYDPGEPVITGLNVRVSGGRVEMSRKDSLMRIFELEPYVSYYLELDKNSFENIAWKLPFTTLKVSIDPNKMKLIEIPVSVNGEASGYVYLQSNSGRKGQGRIFVSFFSENEKFITKTLTESDGYFSFLGLKPGNYYAVVDSAQLSRLKAVSIPAKIPFTIKKTLDGDVYDGLEFTIKYLAPEIDTVQKKQTEKTTDPIDLKRDKEPQGVPDINKKIEDTIKPSINKSGPAKGTKPANSDSVLRQKITTKIKAGVNDTITSVKTKPKQKITRSDTSSSNKGIIKEKTKKTDTISKKIIAPEKEIWKSDSATRNKLMQNEYFMIMQAGAFKISENAEKLAAKLEKKYPGDVTIDTVGGWYKVRVIFTGKSQREVTMKTSHMKQSGYRDAFPVHEK